MKSKLLIGVFIAMIIVSCHKDKKADVSVANQSTNTNHQHSANRVDSADMGGCRFIPVSLANVMIESYLYSINYTHNDSDIKSFSVNADSLRAYLADTSVKNFKLIFAHTESYASSNNFGVGAGYQSGAITIILAGYNYKGDYVYYQGSEVLDHLAPCPYNCVDGSASNPFLQ